MLATDSSWFCLDLWLLRIDQRTPSFIKSQSLRGFSIARIGMAVDIGDSLFVAVYDLEAVSNASTLHGGGKRLIRQLEIRYRSAPATWSVLCVWT